MVEQMTLMLFPVLPELAGNEERKPLVPGKSATSQAAARRIESSGKAARDRARIFFFILARDSYGATREEIEKGLKLPGNTVRPRVWELLGNHGFPVHLAETLRTRRTMAGNKAYVLVATVQAMKEKNGVEEKEETAA